MVFNRKYFKLCFIIYMFINTLALGYLGIEINYLFIPLLIWAVVIIIHDIYKKEFRLTKNYSILMIIQGLILLLATIVNEYSDLNSYVIAIMQLVIYLVIFNNPLSMTKEQIGQEVKVITVLVNILVGVASTISIGMYLAHFSSLANGWKLGVSAGRLSGIYFNSNPAAFLACMTIVLALIAIREKFKGRFWYFLNIFIQFIYILLTKCRMALIILIVIIIMVGYYFFIRRRPYSNLKRILMVSGLVVVIAGTGLIGQQLVEVIPSVGNITRHETSLFQMDQLIEAVQLIVSVTKTALEIWHSEPVIGIGANNFKKIGSQETDVLDYWAIQVVHSHNVFLEALVATGIIGFIIFVIFFVKSVMMVFNVLKKSQGTSMYFIVQMFTMIVLCEFIGGLTDYGVFYIYSLSATLAWCFLGYLYTYQRIIKKEENQ